MSTAKTLTRKRPETQRYWECIIEKVTCGEPVCVMGYHVNNVLINCKRAIERMKAQSRRTPEYGITTAKVAGGQRVMPKGWQYRTVSDEQRQALMHFAASGMAELFLPGLAVMDVEATLQELSAKYGVELRAEYAVHHLPGGATDRACWILKGGV